MPFETLEAGIRLAFSVITAAVDVDTSVESIEALYRGVVTMADMILIVYDQVLLCGPFRD